MSAKKNTLFNYFAKSPTPVTKNGCSKPAGSKVKHYTDSSRASSKKILQNCEHKQDLKKTVARCNDDSPKDLKENEDVNDSSPPKKKRRTRISIIDSEDSEDEFKPGKNDVESSESDEEPEPSPSESEHSASEEETPKGKKRPRSFGQKRNGKKRALVTPGKVKTKKTPAMPTTPLPVTPRHSANEPNGTFKGGTDGWVHLKYEFLMPDKIRDIKRRPATDPNYDPRTLYVPEDFKRNLTPALKQWWEMKMHHYDCILFFKVGKFYEFYHMDAVTVVNELALTYMKGDYAHCGFPEIAYGRFSSSLVDKGYKVARIEQTETPDMMTERCKGMCKPTKFDRVVNREICQVTTKGTRIYTVIDGESKEAGSQFLIAIAEKEEDSGTSAYGVCFIDTSIGRFHIGQFVDDRHASNLRTLLAHHPPAQVLYERNQISKRTQQVLGTTLSGVLKESLAPETEFWTACKTLMTLAEKEYFEGQKLPAELQQFVGDSDTLGLTAGSTSELGVRALGACVWYLTQCCLDHQLLSMGSFRVYEPVNKGVLPTLHNSDQGISGRHMVLDAVTLKNLNVLVNSCGTMEGTLLQRLDNCCTPFGKRLLHHWLCSPLSDIASIQCRQLAVSTLLDSAHIIQETKALLVQLPDLERLLSRIYAQSSNGLNVSHPENRAILFEEKTFSKRKILEFSAALKGFQLAQQVAKLVQDADIAANSELLAQCSHFPSCSTPGKFPDLDDHLKFFENAFNHEEALKEGRIIPRAGVDSEYDNAVETLDDIDRELKEFLKQQCAYFGCKVNFVGADKKRFQVEVPDHACRKAGSSYDLQGQRKGYKRYWTAEAKELLERQLAAEDLKLRALKDLRKRIFSKFSERTEDWNAAVNCLAVLDVMLSLAEYCRSQEVDMCVPQFVSAGANEQAFVRLVGGRYPCVTGDEVFIPNDTMVGGERSGGASLVLVTGPNMGGKSTLMRQLGVIVIMAQTGCQVPAVELVLNPVDRIFTRLGANDDIMAGESTFYLELCETSAILSHATRHSLVLIDELGRGTSTYDGTAIASAVAEELCTMDCRTLFSTHYHTIVEDFKDNPKVKLGHMACMAEADGEAEDGTQETITFLYKFAEGACPKSYGFNAARLAGVPAHITRRGHQIAKQLEHTAMQRRLFKKIFHADRGFAQLLASL